MYVVLVNNIKSFYMLNTETKNEMLIENDKCWYLSCLIVSKHFSEKYSNEIV